MEFRLRPFLLGRRRANASGLVWWVSDLVSLIYFTVISTNQSRTVASADSDGNGDFSGDFSGGVNVDVNGDVNVMSMECLDDVNAI